MKIKNIMTKYIMKINISSIEYLMESTSLPSRRQFKKLLSAC